MVKVPVIDLLPYRTGADKHGVARAVNTACEDTGFLLISGHGVDEALIANMERVSHAFFDLPVEEKIKVGQPAPDVLRGYIGVAGESLARSRGVKAAGDLNESLMIGRPTVPDETYYRSGAAGHHFAVNLWPHAPEDLRDVWTAYYSEMERLAVDIMRVFALALGVSENYFDDKIDKHISRIRVRCYPPVRGDSAPDQSRAGAHTDYGSLTILRPQEGAGGLQVHTKDGTWIDIPDVPGTFIVNIGDLMARWTNDRWVSTLHRVVVPDTPAARACRRLSVVFFHNPNYDAMIECVPTCCGLDALSKYRRTPAGDYLKAKFLSAQTGGAASTA